MKLKSVKVLFLYFLLIIISSCAVNPVTGKKELMLVSLSQEKAIGKKTDQQVRRQFGIYPDKNLTNYINFIGQRLVRVVHRYDITYKFTLIDTPTVNAFAVPGGYVYVTRGILAYINNEAQLAGILGHELGHINAKHSLSRMSEAMLFNLGFTIGQIAIPELRNYSSLFSKGIELLFLKFSRDDEKQADQLGVLYSTLAGYDAKEMAKFFKILKKMDSKRKTKLPEWLSTHPDPANRVVNVLNLTHKYQKKFPRKVFIINRKEYLSNIDGLVFGKDPRQGFVENGFFYHPILKFKFLVPKNFKIYNLPSEVVLQSNRKDSIIIFMLIKALSLRDAVNKFINKTHARVFSSKKMRINGLDCIRIESKIKKNIVSSSYFFRLNSKYYLFHCLYKSNIFGYYVEKYRKIPLSFAELFDKDKLNRKPIRIHVVKSPISGKFKNILNKLGYISQDDLKKISLLNGIELYEPVREGELIKILK